MGGVYDSGGERQGNSRERNLWKDWRSGLQLTQESRCKTAVVLARQRPECSPGKSPLIGQSNLRAMAKPGTQAFFNVSIQLGS